MSTCSTCPSKNGCSKNKENCGVKNNPLNNVKNVIGVMSGKGGVGKSSISALIAKQLNNLGYKVGVLDADITGPSIPRLFGLKKEKAIMQDGMILPVSTNSGIKAISLNLLTENESDPVIWRGPMISGIVEQFWKDVYWGELDYLVIDMPPGTGDVALTVMKSIPISGVVMVSVPQNLVSMIVSKAVNMARKMDINILGVIENMSYIKCPDCNKKISLFNGESTNQFLDEMNLKLLAELPMINSINNLSEGISSQEEIDLNEIFKPIVKEIIDDLKK